ncbi:PA2779 family protein [Alkalilimnicola ehrlichii]|nr:PA2779 family protein [Alkalilimnicola ehrlichii]
MYLKNSTVLMVAFLLAATILVSGAQASLIGTGEVLAAERQVEQRAKLEDLLAREDVREQLEKMGVDPAFAAERVQALTAEEVDLLVAQLEALPAGGNGIIGAALIVFLVLLITDIMGYTEVFPFVTRTAN